MLQMTWQHYVGRMYTDDQGTLVSDAIIFEVLQQVESDVETFESLSEPSKKLKRPLSSDQASRKELEIVDIEESSSAKRSRQDLTFSRSLPSVPVKIPGVGSTGVYFDPIVPYISRISGRLDGNPFIWQIKGGPKTVDPK